MFILPFLHQGQNKKGRCLSFYLNFYYNYLSPVLWINNANYYSSSNRSMIKSKYRKYKCYYFLLPSSCSKLKSIFYCLLLSFFSWLLCTNNSQRFHFISTWKPTEVFHQLCEELILGRAAKCLQIKLLKSGCPKEPDLMRTSKEQLMLDVLESEKPDWERVHRT